MSVRTAIDYAGRHEPAQKSAVSAASSLHILLVEDHTSMRSILCRMLHEAGVGQISEAEDGREALDFLKINWHNLPDLVISDLYMKHVDGLEFCRRLTARMRAAGQDIPFLLLTGEQDMFIHDVARQVGARAILTKPITREELLHEIGQVIGFTVESA